MKIVANFKTAIAIGNSKSKIESLYGIKTLPRILLIVQRGRLRHAHKLMNPKTTVSKRCPSNSFTQCTQLEPFPKPLLRATIWHRQRERSTRSPPKVCKRVDTWNFPMNASGRLPKKTTMGGCFHPQKGTTGICLYLDTPLAIQKPCHAQCSLSLLLRKDWLLPVHSKRCTNIKVLN